MTLKKVRKGTCWRVLWLYVKWRLKRALRPVTRAFSVGQRHKLGVQWQRETEDVLEHNRLVRPTVLKSVNCRTRLFWQMLAGDNPDALLVYRHYPNWDWQDDPERCAVRAVDELRHEIGIPEDRSHYLLDIIDAVECNNEFVHSHEHARHADADRYMAAFAWQAADRLGLKTVALNSACGHFAEELIGCFPLTLEALAETGGYLGMHEYDAWTMDRIHRETVDTDGGFWLCGKWKRAMGPVWEKYGDAVKLVVTECGVDGGVVGQPGKGWRDVDADPTVALESYCGEHSLAWYNDLLNGDDLVVGAAIFIVSGEGDWSRFDIAGTEIPERIARMPGIKETGGEMDDEIRVFDMDGVERDFEYAKSKYGVAFRRASVAAGQKVYRLVELREKTGNASLITKVLDEAGQPVADADVAIYWPDAPDPPDPPTELLPHDWYGNFTHGPTNANGDVGPGMGKGAYHGQGEGGPHAVWVRDPGYPSDICEKLGMLAGTFHDHLDQKFQLTVAGEEPQPTGDLAAEVNAIGDRLKEIAAQMGNGGITEIVVKRAGAPDRVFVEKAESLVARAVARAMALVGR